LIAFAVSGLAVWQLGEQTGAWRRLAVKRAADGWRSQKDADDVEMAIDHALQAMAIDLERGQIEQALSGIHPERQDQYRSQLNGQTDKAADFAAALKSAKVIYISSDTGNYESGRMAMVSASLPDRMLDAAHDDKQVDQTFTIVMVWYEDRWVIDS